MQPLLTNTLIRNFSLDLAGNRPFQCEVCSATFCRKQYLEIHQRTHTGEKPFECTTCLKRFSQRSTLNIHKRVHTGKLKFFDYKNSYLDHPWNGNWNERTLKHWLLYSRRETICMWHLQQNICRKKLCDCSQVSISAILKILG